MKVYVATKFEEQERAREVMDVLRSHGHTITYDWTRCEINDAQQARRDAQGVMDANAFVGIFEKDLPYKGALVEFGIAIGMGLELFILGDAPVLQNCIFFKLPYHKDIEKLLSPELHPY